MVRRLLLVLLALPASARPGPDRTATVDLASPGLVAAARSTPVGRALRVTGVAVGPGGSSAALELRRFDPFAAEALVVVHGEGGASMLPPPENVYLRGTLDADPSVRAALSVLASGEVRGLLAGRGGYWIVSDRLDGEVLSAPLVRAVDPAELDVGEPFSCAAGDLDEATGTLRSAPPATAAVVPPQRGEAAYAATVAVETDFEYFQLFGGTTEAVDYAVDLLAWAQVVYAPEADTEMRIGEVSLWTVPGDPWQESSTACGLFEFGRFWNDNRKGVQRTLAHFLSGKNNGGGIAWIGVLCSDEFDFDISRYGCATLSPAVDDYGGDYGYSGDLDGNFDLGNPSVLWDVVVTAHEMGHNFNSPHTHCYAGIGGSGSPVDMCYGSEQGCYNGPTDLPGPGCPGPGSGCGTIMSYCHLLAGGIGNISWTFGESHPYGVQPDRVPARMSVFAASTHAAAPACLPLASLLFTDGFESGGTGAWDGTVD